MKSGLQMPSTPLTASATASRRLTAATSLATLPLMLLLRPALAADAQLSWQAIDDPRSITYELRYGKAGEEPSQLVSTDSASATVADLVEGTSYAFSVRACVTDSTLCSAFSSELISSVPYAAPQAAFSADIRTGEAPLTVRFTGESTGAIDERSWTFGDGSSATGSPVEHRYERPGSYSVALTVTGPGGTDTESRTDYIEVLGSTDPGSDPSPNPDPGSGAGTATLEFGEVELNHTWQWVEFEQPWADPVVVARPLSNQGGQPALVRIDGITNEGFWVRIQEWDYLDGTHVTETLGWMVMNAGAQQTEDGRWIEAGKITTDRTLGFIPQSFTAPFAEAPVVLSAVASDLDPAPVVSRLRQVNTGGFQIGMREEEAADQIHGQETLTYIAIEPGVGPIGGHWAAVASTLDEVTHNSHPLVFESSFSEPPVLLAQMQTTDGGDTANLRWTFRTPTAVDLWVDEEQSRDSETAHTHERVGYLLLGSDNAGAPSPDWMVYEDAEDGNTLGWRLYAGPGGATISNRTDPDVGGRVIQLSGSGWSNGYHLRRADGQPWADSTHSIISWDLKYAEDFHIYVDVETSRGQVYLEYTPADPSSTWAWEQYVHHGVGTDLTDGRWHSIERDLAQDLADGYPGAQLLEVNGFLIRGSGRIDNIRMR